LDGGGVAAMGKFLFNRMMRWTAERSLFRLLAISFAGTFSKYQARILLFSAASNCFPQGILAGGCVVRLKSSFKKKLLFQDAYCASL
jgi:hypothetical protein